MSGGTLSAGTTAAAQQQASTGGNIAVQQQASTGGSAASSLSSYLASQQGGISSASNIAAILKSGTLEGASAYSPNYLNASIQPSQNKSFWSKFIDNTAENYLDKFPNAPSYNPNILVSTNLAGPSPQQSNVPTGILIPTPSRLQILGQDIATKGLVSGTLNWAGEGLGELLNIGFPQIGGGSQYNRLGEFIGNTLPFFTPAAPYLLAGEGIEGLSNLPASQMARTTTSEYLQSNLGISPSAASALSYVPPAVETGLGLLGIGSIAKNVVSKTQSGQAPEITFQAQVRNLPSGNQQVSVLTGSTLGKATSLSASRELVFPETILNPASEGRFIPAEQINLNPTEVYQITPSGRLIQAGKEITEVKNIPSAANENIASLGGGYSKTLIGKETILSKFVMGGTAQPLGNINLFSTNFTETSPD